MLKLCFSIIPKAITTLNVNRYEIMLIAIIIPYVAFRLGFLNLKNNPNNKTIKIIILKKTAISVIIFIQPLTLYFEY